MSGGSSPLTPSTHSSSLRSRAIISIVTLILITAPSSTLAQGGPTKIGPFEVAFSGTNPCTGDQFAGTSRMTFILYERVDGSTGSHTTVRSLVHSQATTLLLNPPRKYEANSESGFQLNHPSSGSAEFTETVNQVLVRQGEEQSSVPMANDDDFRLKETVHLTVNSNGIITAEVANGHEKECAGPPVGPAAIIVP